jgi:prolyl oligopeptidase
MPPEQIMKRELFCLLTAAVLSSHFSWSQTSTVPTTRHADTQETLHGVTVADPYRWLEDQDSPETRSWIAQQNQYTHNLLARWPGREHLQKRLAELKKVDRISTPSVRNGRFFYRKRAADQEQYVIYTRLGDNGPDEV